MSSLVIGLDIGGSHITATLVRIEQPSSSNQNITIERNAFYTRTIDNNLNKDPRSIVSIWIECIEDLIHDFVNNFNENDKIIGIACGIPGPMDYERGISYIQSTQLNKCDKFFGLNLRLSMGDGLRNLSDRWKHIHHPKYFTPATSPRSSIINQEETHESISLIKEITDYCGLQDNEIDSLEKDKENSLPNSELNLSEKSSIHHSLTPKIWTIIKQLSDIPISFYNDATCFAIGEANSKHNKVYKRILALTLGTGFGSTFIDDGEIILNRHDVPPGGMLWNYPYKENSIADDCFSTRGLVKIYNRILQEEFINEQSSLSSNKLIDGEILAEQALNGDENAIKAFRIFARLLGEFLIPHIEKFHTDLIIIGGGLAHSYHLIRDEISKILQASSNIPICFSLSHEKSICLGAVYQQIPQLFQIESKFFRQTDQNLLPVIKTLDTNQYDLYPCHEIPRGNHIGIGHKQLNEKLFNLIEENHILLIDGFVGTYFNEFACELNKYYHEQIKKTKKSSLIFYDTRTFLQTDCDKKRKSYLKYTKSIFGKLATDLDFKEDFIDAKKLDYLKNNLSYPCVIIGPGASFVDESKPLIYIDLTKNELYYRIAAQTAGSYLKPKERSVEKSHSNDDYELTSAMYEQKCLYFLDYPIFNKLKQLLLSRINIFIDGQRPNCPTWLDGNIFRQTLDYIVNKPIRVRPWFEPGPWGGQWLKSVCTNLSQSPKNYAWSFEMITPENGIILSDVNHHLLEFSWDIFYGSQARKILGNDEHYKLFGDSNDFPIRFDFLDTIDGGNLSIQCHPNLQYMRTNFGEKITQDETYYILETKQHWNKECIDDKNSSSHVYLGFQDNTDPEEFHQALLLSRKEKQELNVSKYIQCIPSNIHDFFLIPNETIHASGHNQVVLEISATPYIYTFKLYDWLRLGLDNRLRPLNIEHGMKNLKFDRRGEQLRCQPRVIHSESNQYVEQHLPTHDLHFYDVHRLIIQSNESIEIIRSTDNRFHLCMLVEGDAIEIEYEFMDNNQEKQRYNYIETFLIPASITQYRLRPIIKDHNKKPQQFVLLIAFLKTNCEKLLE
ncbi:unnamed protein product [Adineta steineri]|uniref:ROK family protein n=1 Tax=Adineta steineri TaxID=433720 RepID=A0A818QL23_9BILA|nr:unnamed protein product [Adineta steineri]